MRINVYAAEITKRVERIEKKSETGASFIGVRFYLESSEKLQPPHHPDDDSSAVTFWIKSGKTGHQEGESQWLAELLRGAADLLVQPKTAEKEGE